MNGHVYTLTHKRKAQNLTEHAFPIQSDQFCNFYFWMLPPIYSPCTRPSETILTNKASIERQLRLTLARHFDNATKREVWTATCLVVREKIIDRFIETQAAHNGQDTRRVYYLSLEYLMGRLLNSNLRNTGMHQAVGLALSELGFSLEELCEEEHDMGLGNGGLGRLAACFLDSMASMDLPAIGYGIHYQFGLFRQEFEEGRQMEHPDDWLKYGNPWEIVRPQYARTVNLYGRVEDSCDDLGDYRPQWVGTKQVEGIPYDLTIVGYGACTVNFLRLWEAKASEQLDLQVFNQGGYVEAVREKAMGESISKVLYPNDETESGKELRLVQQYFFVTCSLQDMIARFQRSNDDWNLFPEKVVVQLNDTHPAVAILELMRIFLDVELMSWERAWELVCRTFAYTNHTLLPEALETWSEGLFEKVLPRHLQIVREINRRFVTQDLNTRFPEDPGRVKDMSIVADGQIRMAFLSVVVKLPEPSFVLNLIALLPVGTTGVSLNALISITSFSVRDKGSAGVAFLVPLSVTVNSKSSVPDALAVASNFKPCNSARVRVWLAVTSVVPFAK